MLTLGEKLQQVDCLGVGQIGWELYWSRFLPPSLLCHGQAEEQVLQEVDMGKGFGEFSCRMLLSLGIVIKAEFFLINKFLFITHSYIFI